MFELKVGQRVHGSTKFGEEYDGTVFSVDGYKATIERDDVVFGAGEHIEGYGGGWIVRKGSDGSWKSNGSEGEELTLLEDAETPTTRVWKEGDKVRVKNDCSGAIAGEVYELAYGNKEGSCKDALFAWKDGETKDWSGGCACEDNWEIVEEKKERTLGDWSLSMPPMFTREKAKSLSRLEYYDRPGTLTPLKTNRYSLD